MTRMFKSLIGGAALALAAAASSPALACGAPQLKPASYDGGARFIPAQATSQSIVGMWNVTFNLPNNGVFDTAYVVWHSDGTEIENSISRSPASENFCLGVWTEVAANVYALNHYALSYDPSTGALNGKVLIRERVRVATDGMTYSGPYNVTIFDPKSGRPVQRLEGTLTGTRITVQ